MLIRTDNRPVYVTCKRCDSTFKLGGSCKCKAVKTEVLRGGAVHIEEDEANIAVVDTE